MQRVKNRRKHVYFRPIDRCISVTVEDGHIVTMEYSYNGRLIGSRIHAFDQYQFRWPWIMLHNLVLFQDCMAVHKCMTTNTTYWTGSVDFSDGRVTIESRKFRRYTVTKDDIFLPMILSDSWYSGAINGFIVNLNCNVFNWKDCFMMLRATR